MEAQFYRRDELAHWGIKGQKWGVRRYQNEDGTLTEEGKKHYMAAARAGKLDPKKLSDKDLDMINNRFNKEKQYAQNVSDYQKSRFSNRLKEAVITRIKGNGGKGGKGKGGGKSFASLLATPIKKALEDAVKFDSGKGSGKGNGRDDEDERQENKSSDWRDALVNGYNPGPENYKEHVKRGKAVFDRFNNPQNRSSEDVVRERRKKKDQSKSYAYRDNSPRNPYGLPTGRITLNPDEWSVHSDFASCFVITRDDDYAISHYGIKGQKWGVRRYQNYDGTLTKEGLMRYKKDAENARKEIVRASKTPGTSVGTYEAQSMLTSGRVSPYKKQYQELNKVLLRNTREESNNYNNTYGRNSNDKSDRKKAAEDLVDTIAVASMQYINDNFPEKEREHAKAWVYAAWIQNNDKPIKDAFENEKTVEQKEAEKKSETRNSFDNSKRVISKEGIHSWWQRNLGNKEMDSFMDHVYDTQGKLLDKWMTERYEANYADGSLSRLQEQYAKQLAKNLGLPMTNETINYMKEMFINGDD